MQYKLQISVVEKHDHFQMKNCDIFLIFAQNIDRRYTLEPPQRGVLLSNRNLCLNKKKMNTPVNLTFTIYIYRSTSL